MSGVEIIERHAQDANAVTLGAVQVAQAFFRLAFLQPSVA